MTIERGIRKSHSIMHLVKDKMMLHQADYIAVRHTDFLYEVHKTRVGGTGFINLGEHREQLSQSVMPLVVDAMFLLKNEDGTTDLV